MDARFRFCALMLGLFIAAVFMASHFLPWLAPLLTLDRATVLAMPWTPVSKMFVHADWQHLLYNLFGLMLFGSMLERWAGWRSFLIVFFAAGIASGLGGLAFYSSIIGASGAIFGVMGCLAVIRPRQLALAFGVPVSMWGAVVVYAAFDFLLFFSADGVAHASHLIGLGAGIVMGLELRPRMPRQQRKDEPEWPTEKELEKWERDWMLSP